jgi:D-serine deaminase-like pyridoxal phosphate-dependent protein
VTFSPAEGRPGPKVGDRIRLVPAHVDPTVAYHRALHVVDGAAGRVVDTWPVDLRGW